ncbi:unnamed protein product, partial [Closterium sp. NIES-53]
MCRRLDALARAKRAAAGIPEKPPVTVAAARFAEEGADEGEKTGGGKWVADEDEGGGGRGDREGEGGGSVGDKSGGGGSKERRRYRARRHGCRSPSYHLDWTVRCLSPCLPPTQPNHVSFLLPDLSGASPRVQESLVPPGLD